jgi:hypothetical protein
VPGDESPSKNGSARHFPLNKAALAHTLAAVQKLDAKTGEPTDTTNDTVTFQQKRAEVVLLQQSA